MQMVKNSLFAISLVLLFLVLAACTPTRTASVGQGGTSTITRVLPTTSTPGIPVTVTLQVGLGPRTECVPADPACNDYYIVNEVLPATSTGGLASDPACEFVTPTRLVCVAIQSATSHAITYQAVLRDTPATFTGTYMVQGDNTPTDTGGSRTVIFSIPPPTTNTSVCGTCSALLNVTCGGCPPIPPTNISVCGTCSNLINSTCGGCPPSESPPTCFSAWTCSAWGVWSNTTCGTHNRTCIDTHNCTAPTGEPLTTETMTCPPPSTSIIPGLEAIGVNSSLIIIAVAALIFFATRKKRKKR